MRGILAVLALNGARAKSRPGYVILTVSLMLAAILAAVLFSGRTDSGQRIVYRAEAPPVSQLLRNQYDAVIIPGAHGQVEIITIKGARFQAELRQRLAAAGLTVAPADPSDTEAGGGPEIRLDELPALEPSTTSGRGLGATIVGFLTMFVLLSGSTYMTFFTDDVLAGTFRRAAISPAGLSSYLAGQLLFNGLMLLLPVLSFLWLLRSGFGVHIGFSLGQYALLLGLLTALATAFGFFTASVTENADNALALSSMVIIVTSLLGGTFFHYEHDDAFMRFITGLLPQNSLMTMARGMEQGWPPAQMAGSAGHLAAVTLLFIGAGWLICRQRLQRGIY